jgi:hypothetical protein
MDEIDGNGFGDNDGPGAFDHSGHSEGSYYSDDSYHETESGNSDFTQDNHGPGGLDEHNIGEYGIGEHEPGGHETGEHEGSEHEPSEHEPSEHGISENSPSEHYLGEHHPGDGDPVSFHEFGSPLNSGEAIDPQAFSTGAGPDAGLPDELESGNSPTPLSADAGLIPGEEWIEPGLEFPPALDTELPGPVDGPPWTDTALLGGSAGAGEGDGRDWDETSAEASCDPEDALSDLLRSSGESPDLDWAAASASEDPVAQALARWWDPSHDRVE